MKFGEFGPFFFMENPWYRSKFHEISPKIRKKRQELHEFFEKCGDFIKHILYSSKVSELKMQVPKFKILNYIN